MKRLLIILLTWAVSQSAFGNGSDTVLSPPKISSDASDSQVAKKILNSNIVESLSDGLFKLIREHLIFETLVETDVIYVEATSEFLGLMSYNQMRNIMRAIAFYQHDLELSIRFNSQYNEVVITTPGKDRSLILFVP